MEEAFGSSAEDFFAEEAAEEEANVPVVALETEKELFETLIAIGEFRREKSELEARVKLIAKELARLEPIAEATFDARGVSKLAIEGVGLFYTQTALFPAVHDKPKFVEWLDQVGEGALAVRAVHPQTLKKFWKTSLERGSELPPPEVASAFEKRTIRLRKAK